MSVKSKVTITKRNGAIFAVGEPRYVGSFHPATPEEARRREEEDVEVLEAVLTVLAAGDEQN